MPNPEARVHPPGGLAAFEIEDLLLAAWVLSLGYLLAPGFGTGRVVSQGSLTPLGWMVIAAFLAVLLSRGPTDNDLDRAILRRTLAVGPFYFVLSIGALLGNGLRALAGRARARRLGLTAPDAPTGWPGPPLPAGLRRALAVPYEIFGESLFRSFCGSELDLWTGGAPLVERPFVLVLAFVLIGAGYLVLVIGPRVVAGATLDWRPWLLRFALYLGAAVSARPGAFAP